MPTLDELKKRATAAELTLIEATEAALRKDVQTELTERVIRFVTINFPPNREDARFDPSVGQKWATQFEGFIRTGDL